MIDEIPKKEPKDFFDQVLKDNNDLDILIEGTLDTVANLQVKNIDQHRELLKHFTWIFVTVLAVVISAKYKVLDTEYFYYGVGIYIIDLIFTLTYLREALDNDGLGLLKQQDKFETMYYEKKEIISKYLNQGYVDKNSYMAYLEEVKNSEGAKTSRKDYDDRKEDIKNRDKQSLEYLFEFIIFLFITGSFFLGNSFLNIKIELYQLVLIIIMFGFLSFADYAKALSQTIGKVIMWIKRKVK